MSDITVAHAHVLKRLRKSSNLSQKELADRCNLDRTFISLLERGERQPSLTTLFAVAKVLKVSPSVIVTQIENFIRRGLRKVSKPSRVGRN